MTIIKAKLKTQEIEPGWIFIHALIGTEYYIDLESLRELDALNEATGKIKTKILAVRNIEDGYYIPMCMIELDKNKVN